MKLLWIGNLVVVLTGALMLVSEPVTNPQRGNAAAPPDVWGGRGVSMKTTPQGATLEFDCAHGNILEPIKADAKGEFVARGTYTPERGGPVTQANPPQDLPATYKGTIEGDTMRVEVVLADNNAQAPEPFILTRGKAGRLVKCR
ncbi:MAG: hypothetical protein WCC92_17870 [Candidatus Korobacteraceae bacterium]